MVQIVDMKEYINDTKKIVTVKIFDSFGKSFIGQARCGEEDTFDTQFGINLALLRAQRKMIRAYLKEDKDYHEIQKQGFQDYCKRMEAEIQYYSDVLDGINKEIDNQLDNAEA
jgi:hypothetical protein